MTITIQPDGLHLNPQETLQELIDEPRLHEFAAGLIPSAVSYLPERFLPKTLNKTLHLAAPWANPLINALMVLDAEIQTTVKDTARTLPMNTFLEYRESLAEIPLDSVRLPPLNPDGHYYLVTTDDEDYLALRLDLHPQRGVMGHVRLAVSHANRPPTRLLELEGRLTWQALSPDLITEVSQLPLPEPLTASEQTMLTDLLHQLYKSVTPRS